MTQPGDFWNGDLLFPEQDLLFPVLFTDMMPDGLSQRVRRRPGYRKENETVFMGNNQCRLVPVVPVACRQYIMPARRAAGPLPPSTRKVYSYPVDCRKLRSRLGEYP